MLEYCRVTYEPVTYLYLSWGGGGGGESYLGHNRQNFLFQHATAVEQSRHPVFNQVQCLKPQFSAGGLPMFTNNRPGTSPLLFT